MVFIIQFSFHFWNVLHLEIKYWSNSYKTVKKSFSLEQTGSSDVSPNFSMVSCWWLACHDNLKDCCYTFTISIMFDFLHFYYYFT